MPSGNGTTAPAGVKDNMLYVAVEISRKIWVIGIKSPLNERISLYAISAANVEALRELIERRWARAYQAFRGEIRVLNCYEAGYEGF